MAWKFVELLSFTVLVEASFMKFLVGAVNTDTLVKRNEARVLD